MRKCNPIKVASFTILADPAQPGTLTLFSFLGFLNKKIRNTLEKENVMENYADRGFTILR